MKKQEIISEGLCGMQVNFNLQDMYAAANFVNNVNRHFETQEAYEAWRQKYWDKSLRYEIDPETEEQICRWNTWDEYEKLYPKPEVFNIDEAEMLKAAAKFFKKVASKPESEATIFSDED